MSPLSPPMWPSWRSVTFSVTSSRIRDSCVAAPQTWDACLWFTFVTIAAVVYTRRIPRRSAAAMTAWA